MSKLSLSFVAVPLFAISLPLTSKALGGIIVSNPAHVEAYSSRPAPGQNGNPISYTYGGGVTTGEDFGGDAGAYVPSPGNYTYITAYVGGSIGNMGPNPSGYWNVSTQASGIADFNFSSDTPIRWTINASVGYSWYATDVEDYPIANLSLTAYWNATGFESTSLGSTIGSTTQVYGDPQEFLSDNDYASFSRTGVAPAGSFHIDAGALLSLIPDLNGGRFSESGNNDANAAGSISISATVITEEEYNNSLQSRASLSSVVPEPGTAALTLSVLCLGLGSRRRRR